jgi:hypothetical protein
MDLNVHRDRLVKQIRLRPAGLARELRDLLMEFVREFDHPGNHAPMIAFRSPTLSPTIPDAGD